MKAKALKEILHSKGFDVRDALYKRHDLRGAVEALLEALEALESAVMPALEEREEEQEYLEHVREAIAETERDLMPF